MKEAEGEAQVEVTMSGKRVVRKRKLPDHDDATVGTLSLQITRFYIYNACFLKWYCSTCQLNGG